MGKLYSITSSGLRPLIVKDYALGQLVRYTGDMANAAGIGAIVAIREATTHSTKSYDVALTDGRQFCGTFLDGSRWQVSDEVTTPDAVDVLRAGVVAKEAADKAKQSAANQDFAQSIERLKAEYRHLQQGSGPVIAAKNLRTELKRAFPAVSFQVRTEKYSGGNSVNVSWTDGPTREQVEKIANKYAGGTFDGMTDSYEHKRSPWTELFGEAKYVFCNRSYSDKAVESVIRRVCNWLGGIDQIPTVADYRSGNLWKFKQSGGCDVQREINTALAKHTYCVGVR